MKCYLGPPTVATDPPRQKKTLAKNSWWILQMASHLQRASRHAGPLPFLHGALMVKDRCQLNILDGLNIWLKEGQAHGSASFNDMEECGQGA